MLVNNVNVLNTHTAVAIFTGDGADPECIAWETCFWEWWGAANPGELNFVYVDALQLQHGVDLQRIDNLKFWVQPGGDAYRQQLSLGTTGKANVLRFLHNRSGTLVATCAGWYAAARDYWWQGCHYCWPNLLGLYPTVEGSVSSVADFYTPPGHKMVAVSTGTRMLYYGGPTLGWRHTPRSSLQGRVVLTFTDHGVSERLPAAVVDGKNVFFSVHAEAFEGNAKCIDLSTAERVRNYQWRAEQINAAGGTRYAIPDSAL